MDSRFKGRIISKIELVTVGALQLLVTCLVGVATCVLFVLFFRNVTTHVGRIDSIAELLPLMQTSFAGVLTVVLGLELLETLRVYFKDHRIRLEIIMVVAIIAAGRHVIQVDFEHTPGPVLLRLAAVIVALTLGFFLVKKDQDPQPQKSPPDDLGMAPRGLPAKAVYDGDSGESSCGKQHSQPPF